VKRTCKRCGKKIHKSEHSNVIYCSERCSRPTVAEFKAGREREQLTAPGKEGK
jgi:endogenous inhibitor of DNA gyrase (YacG/DUF329 family)